MKVAAIQHDIVWEDSPATFALLEPLISAAAEDGAQLVVLTEMFSTGFSMRTDRTAEPLDGPSTTFLVGQATQHGVWVCGSLPAQTEGQDRPFNQLVLATPDGEVHRYAKVHLFAYGQEHDHFAAGDKPLSVEVEGLRCSFFVCYDLRFPEPFGAVALDTDCYVIVANWPSSRREHWRALLVARAIENQAYVVGVNRVGHGGKLDYSGDSLIIDPWGSVLADAGSKPGLLTEDVDPQRVAVIRAEFPFLADR